MKFYLFCAGMLVGSGLAVLIFPEYVNVTPVSILPVLFAVVFFFEPAVRCLPKKAQTADHQIRRTYENADHKDTRYVGHQIFCQDADRKPVSLSSLHAFFQRFGKDLSCVAPLRIDPLRVSSSHGKKHEKGCRSKATGTRTGKAGTARARRIGEMEINESKSNTCKKRHTACHFGGGTVCYKRAVFQAVA